MSFAHPERLMLLVVVPVLSAIGLWAWRRRRRDWRVLGCSGIPPADGTWAWLAALGVLILALAGPRWGRWADTTRPAGHDVVLLVDVSRSMAAEDAVPDRLELAVAAAAQLVEAVGQEPGGRVGVVAFAGRGVLRCPLTANLGAVLDVLRSLRTGSIRPGGTDLAAALEAALDAFGTEGEMEPAGGRSIIVLSDGEDSVGAWPSALPRLRESRVIVHAVAVGDAASGHPIPVVAEGSAGRDELQYEGQTVLSRRHDAALQAIAAATGGAFLPLGLSRPEGLEALYLDRIAPLVRLRRPEAQAGAEPTERYAAFVLVALGIGLVGSWVGSLRGRRAPALLGVLLVVVPAFLGAGPDRGAAAAAVRRGNAAFTRGRWTAALSDFDRAITLDPDSALARYNAAAALSRLGRFAEAAARYQEARTRADARMCTKIDFALGNTAFAQGDPTAAIRFYDACLESRAAGADLDAVRRDALVNRQFVARFQAEHPREQPEPSPSDKANRPAPPPPERDSERPGEPKSPRERKTGVSASVAKAARPAPINVSKPR